MVFLAQIELLNSFLVKLSGISCVGDSLDHWAEQDLSLASLRSSLGDVKQFDLTTVKVLKSELSLRLPLRNHVALMKSTVSDAVESTRLINTRLHVETSLLAFVNKLLDFYCCTILLSTFCLFLQRLIAIYVAKYS